MSDNQLRDSLENPGRRPHCCVSERSGRDGRESMARRPGAFPHGRAEIVNDPAKPHVRALEIPDNIEYIQSHDLRREAEIPSSRTAEEHARLHPPRLRGEDLDAVRGLRPRLRSPASIIEACFELSIEPHRVAKISGIGCSSKTPDYFLGNSHGFNSVHGRMPSVLTGANLANRDLIYLGVSGDGNSASIGFGQFAHAMRRGVNMVYIVENNGVYGLTKGQFSATADRGSKSKRGLTNNDNAIDMVGHRAAARRELRRPLVLRRQGATGADDQGRDRAPGRRFHRRDLALRRLQQSRRLDQELRLRARAQRGGQPARLHHRPRADQRRLRAGQRRDWSSSTTARRSRCARSIPSTTCTTGSPP